jgi:mannose-6-phosphate isomerase
MWVFDLVPNPVERFYRGGARIAAFRRAPSWPPQAPEEWLASTTAVFGESVRGLTFIDGKSLRAAIQEDPEGFLGPEYDRFPNAEPGLLIKLLDAGERLPVHYHPNDELARSRLGYPFGKTEAWFIMEAAPDSAVWLGFAYPTNPNDVLRLIAERDSAGLLNLLRKIPVRAGDTLFVPAGTPHAIGEGILMTELQEASDLSVLLEWWLVGDDAASTWHLGLGPEEAVRQLDYTVWNDDVVARMVRHVPTSRGRHRVFPEEADAYFRTERIVVDSVMELEPAYQVLVVLSGQGELAAGGETKGIQAGTVLLIGHAAGSVAICGAVDLLRCLPAVSQ